MSDYERRRWEELNTAGAKRANPKRFIPEKARNAVSAAGGAVRGTGSRLAGAVGDRVPDKVSDVASRVRDHAQAAAVAAFTASAASVTSLVDLLNDWIVELQDPESVLAYHRENGRTVETISDLTDFDLEILDRHTRRLALTWRSIGAAEGAGLGALALIPVPVVGSAAAIGLDIIAMQALATSIAIRVCHCYGFDVRDSEMESVIDAMVSRGYGQQATKAGAVHQASVAWDAAKLASTGVPSCARIRSSLPASRSSCSAPPAQRTSP